MKTKMMITTGAMALLSVAALNAQTTGNASHTETFRVYGNCGMCKARIEKAAKTIDGVQSAEWNAETGMMSVTMAEGRASLDDVVNAIAAAGHDTQWKEATSEAYHNLPGCCQYERKVKNEDTDVQMTHPHDMQMMEMKGVTGQSFTCPMHPEVQSDKPGTCDKCGMQLVQDKKGAIK